MDEMHLMAVPKRKVRELDIADDDGLYTSSVTATKNKACTKWSPANTAAAHRHQTKILNALLSDPLTQQTLNGFIRKFGPLLLLV